MLRSLETTDESQFSFLEPIKISTLEQVPALKFQFLNRPIRFVNDSFPVILGPNFRHKHTVEFLFEYFVLVFSELLVAFELTDEIFEAERGTREFELVHVGLVGFLLVQEL